MHYFFKTDKKTDTYYFGKYIVQHEHRSINFIVVR